MFRSADYNSLIWVFEKLFDSVEAFKPEASRTQSAEIFVVCTGFKAPPKIDPRFFNPKFIFQQNESEVFDAVTGGGINSLKKIFQVKKKSGSLKRDGKMIQYRSIPLKAFIDIENPYGVFVNYNEITLEGKEEIFKLVAPPNDFEEMAKDLKLMGKREVSKTLKWREKVRALGRKKRSDDRLALKEIEEEKQKEKQKEEQKEEQKVEKDSDNEEDEDMSTQISKRQKKMEKLSKKQKDKNYLQFINKRIGKDEVMTERIDNDIKGFDFAKEDFKLGKREQKIESKEEADARQRREDKEELDELLQKRAGKWMKERSQKEVTENLELLYEQKKKLIMRNQMNDERVVKQKTKQRKGLLKKERRKLDERIFMEDDKNEDISDLEDEKAAKTTQNDLDIALEGENLIALKKESKFFSRKIFDILGEDEIKGGDENLELEEEDSDSDAEDKKDKNVDSEDSDAEVATKKPYYKLGSENKNAVSDKKGNIH